MEDRCETPDCPSMATVRGYCGKHYARLRRRGLLPELPERTRAICVVEGCDRPKGTAAGLCIPHERRRKRHGDPLGGIEYRPAGLTVGEVFARHSDGSPTETGCIEWSGTKAVSGYGVFSFGDDRLLAHRVAYSLAYGELPGDAVVRHSCDNPPCVNAEHLSIGTPGDNVRDAVSRSRNVVGERVPSHKLTEDEVRRIRRRFESGELKAHLAREYGVWQKTIDSVVTRKTWKHVR